MIDMIIFIFVLIFLYLLMLRGRAGHPKMEELKKWSYAHRGLHGDRFPENSMGAFRQAVEAGYGMELDVHLMADGNLAVIHDSSLKRTVGVEKKIEELTAAELSAYKLQGTEETIPLFADVLKMVGGRVPLIVEIKTDGKNTAAVTEATCRMLAEYPGLYCVESFDPRAIAYVRKYFPDLVRGQLAHNSLKEKSPVPLFLRFLLTYQLMNCWVVPDFIAYRYADRKTMSNFLCRKLWQIQGVSWTLTDMEQYETAINEDWIPIFEKFKP
ncbi:MAG: glycerophosphodiester phosphodiesterase [Ruminococcaceae bacterium]|nr:glycerophosphodiester phosphodiesterase [Oscillospiraceae bacterium]